MIGVIKNTRYRMPVISPLHDVEVPKHLDLYKEHGAALLPLRAQTAGFYIWPG